MVALARQDGLGWSVELDYPENERKGGDVVLAAVHFINERHRTIFNETSGIPGWQMEGDTHKLYELAYLYGDVILEVGTYAGRSAVVQIEASRDNKKRKTTQFYGVEKSARHLNMANDTLVGRRLLDSALLFNGTLETFSRSYQISPTMVFVDGDHNYSGVKADIAVLSRILRPNTPVVFHDYANPDTPGVKQAVDEWTADGWATMQEVAGCSAHVLTTARSQSAFPNPSMNTFRKWQGRNFWRPKNVATRFVVRAIKFVRNQRVGNAASHRSSH